MKKLIPALMVALIITSIPSTKAQKWLENIPVSERDNTNFYLFQEAYNNYFESHDFEEGQAQKQFKRWEWYMAPRVDQTGRIPGNILFSETQKLIQSRTHKRDITANWQALGPKDTPFWFNEDLRSGSGRIDCIAFHPENDLIMWAGAHSGGLWKTLDGGETWFTTTDELGSIGISSIVVHPENPDILFISTGDRDTFSTFSIGVLKSIDGGLTWNETGLTYAVVENKVVNELIMDPTNPEMMIAATENGIFKTIDGADTWYLVQNGHFKDITFKPGDSEVVYASSFSFYGGATAIFKSINGGESFDVLTNTGIPSSQVCRIALGVSPANPDVLYAFCARTYPNANFYGLFKSSDEGLNWSETVSGDDINLLGRSAYGADTEGYGWYTCSIAVSPLDENEIYIGGINIWKSSDGGYDWEIKTHEVSGILPDVTYMWVDHHWLGFNHNTNVFFTGHDGGVYKSADGADSFTDLSDGLEVLQVYKIALSQSDESIALCGVQDQFAMYMHDETWHCLRTGESGENIIDYTDPQTMYVSGYGGGFRRSKNGGNSFVVINPPGVSYYVWLWPYIMHPTDPNTIYIATNNIFKSTDQGDSWTTITSNLAGGQLSHLEISPSNPNYMLAGTDNQLWRSTLGGIDWANISSGLPGATISDVCFSSTKPDHIWVTYSGFTSGKKVYRTVDGGENWENVSLNLPNLPANCIVHDAGSNGIYVGMDVGVYYITDDLASWVDFSDGLPNVIVNEIEIQYSAGKIRAGTYGRGFWESELYNPAVVINENPKIQFLNIHPNPSNGRCKVLLNIDGLVENCSMKLTDITGKTVFLQEIIIADNKLEKELDLSDQSPGIYFLQIRIDQDIENRKVVLQ